MIKLSINQSIQPTITNRAWSGEYFDKSYDSTYVFVTSDSKKKFRKEQASAIGSFKEARDLLLRSIAYSAARRNREADAALEAERVLAALRVMEKCRGPGQAPGGGVS